MTDDRADAWRAQYEGLFDPLASKYDLVLDVELDENRSGLRRQLRELYQQQPNIDGVLVRKAGLDLCIATRATADRDAGTAGEQSGGVDLGSSDSATLPGLPGEYRVIVFRCADVSCTVTYLVSFYDERRAPSCPQHGPTEIRI